MGQPYYNKFSNKIKNDFQLSLKIISIVDLVADHLHEFAITLMLSYKVDLTNENDYKNKHFYFFSFNFKIKDIQFWLNCNF